MIFSCRLLANCNLGLAGLKSVPFYPQDGALNPLDPRRSSGAFSSSAARKFILKVLKNTQTS